MKRILFVHNNFPAQFVHIARSLAKDPDVQVAAVGTQTARPIPGVSGTSGACAGSPNSSTGGSGVGDTGSMDLSLSAAFFLQQALDVDPELLLRLFEFVSRHGIRLSAESEQHIEARLGHLRDYFAVPQPVWSALNQILSLPHAPLAARVMHETGVLSAIFPEMEQIECLVIRDFYHRPRLCTEILTPALRSVAPVAS